MPTSYTSEIESGKSASFRKYALRCKDAFFHPDSRPEEEYEYYKSEWIEAINDYDRWSKKTLTQKRKTIRAELNRNTKSTIRRQENSKRIKRRYEYMLNEVESWVAKKEFLPLKKFMIDQLKLSIQFDCASLPGPIYNKKPSDDLTLDLILDREHSLKLSIQYASDKMQEHSKRITEKSEYIKKLKASI